MLITFFVIDCFNSAMAFINHPITKTLFLLLGLSSAAVGFLLFLPKSPKKTAFRQIVSILPLFCLLFSISLFIVDLIFPAFLLYAQRIIKNLILLCTLISALAAGTYIKALLK